MIDDDKIRLAHEIAKKLNIDLAYAYTNKNGQWVYWVGVNQLLLELSEMQKDTYKFKEGQKVWYNHPLTNKPVEDEILGIKVKPNDEIQYQFAHYAMMECDVYASEDDIPRSYKYLEKEIVWRVDDEDMPIEVCIREIDTSADTEIYFDGDSWWSEEQLYPTREALIQSQIEYWQNLKEEKSKAACCSLHSGGYEECNPDIQSNQVKVDIDRCQHASDNNYHGLYEIKASTTYSPAEFVPILKCKKCGEFYR